LPISGSNEVAVHAQHRESDTLITWNFTADTDTIWFHIYRSEKPDFSVAQQISEQFIAPQQIGSHIYQFEDNSLTKSGVYFYWVEQVYRNYDANIHGPAALAIQQDQIEISQPAIYLPLIETQ